MGLFGSKKEGGLADVIRCDEKEYLIWKWSPSGEPSKRMNAIRYGSRLRVKEGEVAVFVYDRDGGMDFIEGYTDEVLKTANFPVLSSIVGAAFGGASPFQAEVFFINLSGIIRLPFFVRNLLIPMNEADEMPIPASAKGSISFNITDYRSFISKHQMAGFTMEEFSEKIYDMVRQYVSSVVQNAPRRLGMSNLHIGGYLDQINSQLLATVREPLAEDYGINVRRVDIAEIMLDETSLAYQSRQQLALDNVNAQSLRIRTMGEADAARMMRVQEAETDNYDKTLQANREETQRRQRLETESAYLAAHQINVQGEVARTAAESLGKMGSTMGDGGGGMNPAGMMAGMMMGGAVGSGMANMMGGMMQGMSQPQPPAPPVAATAQYYVAENGGQAGPYNFAQVQQMITMRQITPATFMWKAGMAAWAPASSIPELANAFGCVPPPPPPAMPPVPPAL